MLQHLTDLFVFILTVKQSAALAACVLRVTTKKVVNFFNEISAPHNPGYAYAPTAPSALTFCAPNVKSWLHL